MPRPPIQIHLFRTFVRHYVTQFEISVDYPVTGMIVVPSTVTRIDEYIGERQTTIAQLRMTSVMVRSQGYSNMVATMALHASNRASLGIEPRMPSGSTLHMPVAATCEACAEIALCDRNQASYDRLRARLERICSNVTKFDADFCQSLTLRLNTYAA